MEQRGLTVVVEVLPDQEKSLQTLLEGIGNDIRGNGIIDFSSLETVHFMRWVILPASMAHGRPTPPQLVLSTNFDGKIRPHLKELATRASKGLDAIYSHCKGYPGASDAEAVIQYLRRHGSPHAAFYVGKVGKSRSQVLAESELRDALEVEAQKAVVGLAGKSIPASQLASQISQPVKTEARFKWAQKRWSPPFLVRFGIPLLALALLAVLTLTVVACIRWPLVGLPVLGAVIAFFATWWLLLRRAERQDAAAFQPLPKVPQKIAILHEKEDYLVQNQITHLVEVKPGWVRKVALKLVLGAIYLLARTVFNRGNLGGIPSIHFARWTFVDGGRRLLFFSNFDGSWESYLGEFIDRAAIGLTAVWSNTVGFPPTSKLIWEGARNSVDFKAWVRGCQIPTQVWYSAYKTTTVLNAANNTELRNGLSTPLDEKTSQEWLQRL